MCHIVCIYYENQSKNNFSIRVYAIISKRTGGSDICRKMSMEDKPICPHCCGKETLPRLLRHGHNCKKCKKYFTCRKETVFDNSRLPLKMVICDLLITNFA